MITPSIIAAKAYRNLILNKVAATHPVQAPVTGKGMATNKASPMDSYRCTISAFFSVRANSHSKKRRHNLNLLKYLETGSSPNNRGTTGKRLPRMAKQNVLNTGCLNVNRARGIAPLNSDTGKAATMTVIRLFGKFWRLISM